jgi:hypothetical protein
MYANAVILEIRSLLDNGELSHRAIAEKLGVSRGVVDNIAGGRRGPRHHPTEHLRLSRDHGLGIPARCRHCGGLVYEPCLLCRARKHQQIVQDIRRAVQDQLANQHPRRVA